MHDLHSSLEKKERHQPEQYNLHTLINNKPETDTLDNKNVRASKENSRDVSTALKTPVLHAQRPLPPLLLYLFCEVTHIVPEDGQLNQCVEYRGSLLTDTTQIFIAKNDLKLLRLLVMTTTNSNI